MFFLEMVIFILKWVNLQKMVRNQTKICPGKKFVTNEYPGIYIYIFLSYMYYHVRERATPKQISQGVVHELCIYKIE